MKTSGKLYANQNWIHFSFSWCTYSGSKSMHQISFTQHKHWYMICAGFHGERDIWNLVQTYGMQTNFRPVQTFCTPEVGTHNKEESCKFLFVHILSNDGIYAYWIPWTSFESWGFGPKIGLDGLHCLAQVRTDLPPDWWMVVKYESLHTACTKMQVSIFCRCWQLPQFH